VLLTTHYMYEADALCHRIAVIAEGEIVAEGTPSALKAVGRRRGAARRVPDGTAGPGRMNGLTHDVLKQKAEQRFTFGPLYAPDRLDAHGEYTSADDLQKALWGYVETSSKTGRGINLQHEDYGKGAIGHWVEAVSWPYEVKASVTKAGDKPRTLTMPPGTVYMGVVWTEKAWPALKNGTLNGLSLGGRAIRLPQVEKDAPSLHMGDQRHPLRSPKAKALLERAQGLTRKEWSDIDDLAALMREIPEARSFVEYLIAHPGEEFEAAYKRWGAIPEQRHPSGKFKPRALVPDPKHRPITENPGARDVGRDPAAEGQPRASATVSDAIVAAFRR
jgi:hypothetical protein